MKEKLLLVQSIGLLYWGSKKLDFVVDAKSIIEELLTKIKLPESTIDFESGKDNLVNLKALVESYLDAREELTHPIVRQQLRLCILDDDSLWEAAEDVIADKDDIQSQCNAWMRSIQEYFTELKFIETMKTLMTSSIYSQKSISPRKLATQFIGELTQFASQSDGEGGGLKNPIVVKGGDFSNVELLAQQISQASEQISPDGIMRTGYQGFNRMLGWHGGLVRGDCYCVGARRGNNKTGMTLDITLDVMRYNKPYLYNPDKKPAVMHITMENSYDQNLRYILGRAYYEKYGKVVSTLDIDPVFGAELVKEYTSVNGFEFIPLWVPGGTATYLDLQQLVLEFEAKGYEIHLLTIDYLALIDKSGLEQGTAGSEIRDAFRRMRNFCNPKKITLLTPHQISSQATDLVRAGETNFVTKVAGMDYWDGCRRLTQEIDVEIVLNVERVKRDGEVKSFMAMAIGKHRDVKNTPESHKSCAMEFNEWGLIPDVDKEPNYFKNISEIRQSTNGDGDHEDW